MAYTYRPGKVKITTSKTADWLELPWESFYLSCLKEQEDQIDMAKSARMDSYNAFISRKEQEWQTLNPESSCEQNFSEEFPYTGLSRKDLFNIRREANEKVCVEFLATHNFKQLGVQYLNQITKYLSTFKLTTVEGRDYDPKSPDSFISPVAFYKQVFNSNKMLGVYNFLMLDSRSHYLDKQYTAPGRAYCALVPTILMAHKLHNMVPYSAWDPATVEGLVNRKLYEAMSYKGELPSKDQIMEARDIGLEIKSGKDIGKKRSAIYTHKLYGKTSISSLPDLLQVMLTQIWCAHPSNRSKYMILDPNNWDKLPQQLIETDVLIPETFEQSAQDEDNNLPWL